MGLSRLRNQESCSLLRKEGGGGGGGDQGLGVWGLGFRVRVWGLGFGVWDLGFRVSLEFRGV